jgi:hypothetical protein
MSRCYVVIHYRGQTVEIRVNSASIYRVTSTEARFLLKRLARLIVIAEYLVTESSGDIEDQQKFQVLKAEIETINGRLQRIQQL